MTGTDWLWLLGGAVVGGVGINGLVNQFTGPRPNAVAVLLNIALTAVGVSLFFSHLGVATSAARAA